MTQSKHCWIFVLFGEQKPWTFNDFPRFCPFCYSKWVSIVPLASSRMIYALFIKPWNQTAMRAFEQFQYIFVWALQRKMPHFVNIILSSASWAIIFGDKLIFFLFSLPLSFTGLNNKRIKWHADLFMKNKRDITERSPHSHGSRCGIAYLGVCCCCYCYCDYSYATNTQGVAFLSTITQCNLRVDTENDNGGGFTFDFFWHRKKQKEKKLMKFSMKKKVKTDQV